MHVPQRGEAPHGGGSTPTVPDPLERDTTAVGYAHGERMLMLVCQRRRFRAYVARHRCATAIRHVRECAVLGDAKRQRLWSS
jgi:hypothetical protein